MKEYILLILLLLFSTSKAQNVSFEECTMLRDKSYGEVEEFMTSKGWKYTGGQSGEDGTAKFIVFQYGNLIIDLKNSTSSYSVFIFGSSKNSHHTRVLLDISSLEKYSELLSSMTKSGLKLIDSKIGASGILRKIYQDEKDTVVVKVMSDPEKYNLTLYKLIFASNEDFKMSFEIEDK